MSELSIFNLKEFINEKRTTFIETGTGSGAGIEHASKFKFTRMYSMDINPHTCDSARKKFESDKRITILHGQSVDILPVILSEVSIDTGVVFWLDAHFPGAYEAEEAKHIKFPLEDELKIILSMRNGGSKDVFLMDDLRIYEQGKYERGNMPPGFDKFRNKYNMNGTEFANILFGDTHNIRKDYRHEGILVVTPK